MFLYWLSTPYYVALESKTTGDLTVIKKRFFITVDKKVYKNLEFPYEVTVHPKTDTTPASKVCIRIDMERASLNYLKEEMPALTNYDDLDSSITSVIQESGYYKFDYKENKFVDIDPKTEKAVPLSSFSLPFYSVKEEDEKLKRVVVIVDSGKIAKPFLGRKPLSPILLQVVTKPIEITEVE